MSLYNMYNKKQGFNRDYELEKFIKAIEIRCNNLIVCGDKLPFVIRDIKPHEMLNKFMLQVELRYVLGLQCEFTKTGIVVKSINKVLEI